MHRIRRRIHVGCEGKGERSLSVVLQKFAEDIELAVHLDAFDAHGGGPMAVVQKSLKHARLQAARRGAYDGGRFILLDGDRIDYPEMAQQVAHAASPTGTVLVIQERRLECLLGRLLSRRFDLGPQRAERELMRRWPEYSRGFDAGSLKSRLSVDVIRESRRICPEWEALLRAIGFI